jgi:hypothetical protein
MEKESITKPTTKCRDILCLTVNIIPVFFLVKEIKDGIPQIEILPQFNENVIGTEYQNGAEAPLRENQEYSVFRPPVWSNK